MPTMREYYDISDRVLINFSIELYASNCFALLRQGARRASPQIREHVTFLGQI